MDFLRPYTPQLLSILRIMSGLLLLQHGTTKYLNFPSGPMNNASPMTMSGAAGIIELVFGVAPGHRALHPVLRLHPLRHVRSRLFLCSCAEGFFPLLNGGELAVLYSFVFLYLAAAGGGPWSVDRARGGD